MANSSGFDFNPDKNQKHEDGMTAIIDGVPAAAKAEPWARLSDKFSKLPEPAKRRFVEEHWDFIELVLSENRKRA